MTQHTPWSTRAERPEDVPAIREINRAAFPTDDEANLVDALHADDAWIDGLSVVATTESGDIVGYALLTRCHIDDVPALCLAPCPYCLSTKTKAPVPPPPVSRWRPPKNKANPSLLSWAIPITTLVSVSSALQRTASA